MRWGVRDEATDDHMTTELCMREIKNCQRLSMGPNFVVSAAFTQIFVFYNNLTRQIDFRYSSVKSMGTVPFPRIYFPRNYSC